MNEGFLFLHRKLIHDPIFSNEKGLKVWLWCLMKATHKKREVYVGMQKVLLNPGDFVFGRDSAASELQMSPSTVRNWMKVLEKDSYLDRKVTSKYSVVSIKNWIQYQVLDSKKDSRITADKQQSNTNNNVSNVITSYKKKDYGNRFLNALEEEFKKTKGHRPIETNYRREAWALVQTMKKTLRDLGLKDDIETFKKLTSRYFQWCYQQEWFELVQKMRPIREHWYEYKPIFEKSINQARKD